MAEFFSFFCASHCQHFFVVSFEVERRICVNQMGQNRPCGQQGFVVSSDGNEMCSESVPNRIFIKAYPPKHPRQFVNTHIYAIMKTSAKLMIVRLIKFHLMLVYSTGSLCEEKNTPNTRNRPQKFTCKRIPNLHCLRNGI